MARLSFVLATLLLTTPGCSLPRDAIGANVDAGTHTLDAFVPHGADTGIDSARPPVDTGTPPIDMGMPPIDMGTPPIDAGHDAAMVPDVGTCRGDLDCPAATTTGACTYATECATMGTTMQTTTSYTCVDSLCVMHMAMAPCTRATDGTACGGTEPSCAPCTATACGASGMVVCTSHTCMAGACAANSTSTSCSTPNDMCGSTPGWGLCLPDGFSGTCSQSRTWGRCGGAGGSTCFPGGRTDTQSCPCPHFP